MHLLFSVNFVGIFFCLCGFVCLTVSLIALLLKQQESEQNVRNKPSLNGAHCGHYCAQFLLLLLLFTEVETKQRKIYAILVSWWIRLPPIQLIARQSIFHFNWLHQFRVLLIPSSFIRNSKNEIFRHTNCLCVWRRISC